MTSGRHHIPDRVGCLAAVGPHQKYQLSGVAAGLAALRAPRLTPPVLAAYGWPGDPSTGSGHGLTDDEILARLLALNLERAGYTHGPRLP